MDKYYQFDTAQICLSGHVVNLHAHLHPELNSSFCNECGEETIIKCPSCSAPIRSVEYYYEENYLGQNVPQLVATWNYQVPAYCHACGTPYPWTQSRIETVSTIIDTLPDLSPEKVKQLKEFIPDIMSETPKTTLAALIYGQILDSVQSFGKSFLVDWLKKNATTIVLNLLNLEAIK